jgi:hypothetical protein
VGTELELCGRWRAAAGAPLPRRATMPYVELGVGVLGGLASAAAIEEVGAAAADPAVGGGGAASIADGRQAVGGGCPSSALPAAAAPFLRPPTPSPRAVGSCNFFFCHDTTLMSSFLAATHGTTLSFGLSLFSPSSSSCLGGGGSSGRWKAADLH